MFYSKTSPALTPTATSGVIDKQQSAKGVKRIFQGVHHLPTKRTTTLGKVPHNPWQLHKYQPPSNIHTHLSICIIHKYTLLGKTLKHTYNNSHQPLGIGNLAPSLFRFPHAIARGQT